MESIRLVIFDCDGVMFDTKNANTSYYNEILRFLKKEPLTAEQFAYAHMHTADETLALLLSDEKELKSARAYRRAMSYMPFIKDMIVEPHLRPLLTKLRPAFKTAVATNRSDTMNDVLKEHGLEALFDMVVTSLDVVNPKPHPESLLRILDHFRLDPEEALYVGDSTLDELAARGARVPFVAYDNADLDADYHISSLREIEPLVNI